MHGGWRAILEEVHGRPAAFSARSLGGEKSMSGSHVVPALVGLALAWGGTALLVSPAGRLLGSPERITTKCLEQAALWLLLAAIVAIVVSWEKQPLASLWLRPLDGKSVAWGLLFALATICVVIPATEWVRRAADLAGYAVGVEKVLALPIWFRVVAVITAAVVEETLFRGYAVTRLPCSRAACGSLELSRSRSSPGFISRSGVPARHSPSCSGAWSARPSSSGGRTSSP